MNIMAQRNSKLHTIVTNVMVFVLFFTIGFWSYRLNVRTEDSSARTVPTDATVLDLSLSSTAAGELSAHVSTEADYQLLVSSADAQTTPGLSYQETKITLPAERPDQVTITVVASE